MKKSFILFFILLFSIFSCSKIEKKEEINTFIFDFDQTIHYLSGTYIRPIVTDHVNSIKNKRNRKKIKLEIENLVDYQNKNHNYDGVVFVQKIFKKFGIYPTKNGIELAIYGINSKLTNGFYDIFKYLNQKKQKIFIIGGGVFGCAIIPRVMDIYGIKSDQIYSGYWVDGLKKENINESIGEFRFVNCANPNENTPISTKKSEIVKYLREKDQIKGKIIVIGDGLNDLEIYKSNQADKFIGFGVNIKREKVAKESNVFVKNISQLMFEIRKI